MTTSPELVAVIQEERARQVRHDRLARIAAAARDCCSTSSLERLARAVRRTIVRRAPASC
jgi:hypothetical protein